MLSFFTVVYFLLLIHFQAMSVVWELSIANLITNISQNVIVFSEGIFIPSIVL